jgi:hypothetical protein
MLDTPDINDDARDIAAELIDRITARAVSTRSKQRYGTSCWIACASGFAVNHSIIPTPIDQNPFAQSRSPIDLMRQG